MPSPPRNNHGRIQGRKGVGGLTLLLGRKAGQPPKAEADGFITVYPKIG